MSLKRGFARLTLTLSFVLGVLIGFAVGGGDFDYPEDGFLERTLLGLVGFAAAFAITWAVYGAIRFAIIPSVRYVARGFRKQEAPAATDDLTFKKAEKHSGQEKLDA